MSIYDEMRIIANEIMGDPEFKQGTVQYVPIVTTPGPSPDEPTSSGPGTPISVNAVAQPVSTKYVDGSYIVQSDRQVTIPNDGSITPDMNGFVDIDSVRYRIIEIMPKPAAGIPVVWTVIVRR